ncbi:apical complex lysine methyltransferase [Cystoisospora suis]|uniref:Apical complex lysine methyltransferase n=1 Tax=Cystoisospora suis TaxID=483139 RepID=A0A2C6L2S1_9APIC|nr:apical complex lysine methyltransferase [Cystoisospora suis]
MSRRVSQKNLAGGTGGVLSRAAGAATRGLLDHVRGTSSRGLRSTRQEPSQPLRNDSIKRRELDFDEELWARGYTMDYSYKLRHMQESEGTTQVSAGDYADVSPEGEEGGEIEALDEGAEGEDDGVEYEEYYRTDKGGTAVDDDSGRDPYSYETGEDDHEYYYGSRPYNDEGTAEAEDEAELADNYEYTAGAEEEEAAEYTYDDYNHGTTEGGYEEKEAEAEGEVWQTEDRVYDETDEEEYGEQADAVENEYAEDEYAEEADADETEYAEDRAEADVGVEAEDDAAAINPLAPYTLPQIAEKVEVKRVPGKGRCLYTKHDLEPGSIIFVETPVLVAIPSLNEELWNVLTELNEEEAFELPPVWHLAALCSLLMLDDDKKKICLDKWVPEPNKAPSDDVMRVLSRANVKVHPQLYERMLMVWRYNSFGHHTEQHGLVLYNRISMMAHSCRASACWHYGEADAFILRARVKLQAGDELTISYIGDDDLFKSTNVRREKVHGWLFTCQCIRCAAPVDSARGFRCPLCGTGAMFFKTDDGVTTSSACTICQAFPSDETIQEYLDFEQAYVDRLSETDKSDMQDAELVYNQATRVFSQHWVLYQLNTILFEGYRDAGNYEAAAIHQTERIKYVSQVMPLASYTLAWLYEEMGDVMTNQADEAGTQVSNHRLNIISRHFEDAYNLLYILCGEEHDYTVAALTKKTSCDARVTEA